MDAIIAPIASITTRLLTHSNSQSLRDLPIQITSMEVAVIKNPNQTKRPHKRPVEIPGPLVYVEVEANK
jgi:hypothetical protein